MLQNLVDKFACCMMLITKLTATQGSRRHQPMFSLHFSNFNGNVNCYQHTVSVISLFASVPPEQVPPQHTVTDKLQYSKQEIRWFWHDCIVWITVHLLSIWFTRRLPITNREGVCGNPYHDSSYLSLLYMTCLWHYRRGEKIRPLLEKVLISYNLISTKTIPMNMLPRLKSFLWIRELKIYKLNNLNYSIIWRSLE